MYISISMIPNTVCQGETYQVAFSLVGVVAVLPNLPKDCEIDSQESEDMEI